MSYKYDSEIVILGKYGKASGDAKAELFETYDQLRDLTVSGPTMGGSGFGTSASFIMQLAKMFSGSEFLPVFGNQSINIPGTSYGAPSNPGVGIGPAGQAAFGVGLYAATSGFPAAQGGYVSGEAAPLSMLGVLGNAGVLKALQGASADTEGAQMLEGAGPELQDVAVAGGAADISGLGNALGALGGTATGVGAATVGDPNNGGAGAGFARSLVLPAAGLMSGIGGLLTTLGPFLGPYGLAGAAAGTILSGTSGAILSSYQTVSNRILNNADTVLTSKVANIETVVKMLDAQQEVIKKLLKDSMDGDKKALDNL